MKKILILALLFLSKTLHTNATKVNASTFGWNATDATTAFRNAINSSNDTVIVDYNQTGIWVVQSNIFYDLSNKTIIFENGVMLQAKAGAFTDIYACLFQLIRANNVTVIGYGATFKMNRAEAAANQSPHSEWRHSISINNCRGVKIYGLKLDENGGDGVLISGDTWYTTAAFPNLYSENIVLKDLRCDKNFRQGISVGSVDNLLVQNCWFTNTAGTAPEAGVDLESDIPGHRLKNIIFEKCRFTGNNGNGILVAPIYLTPGSEPISITFRDCYTSNNKVPSNGYGRAEIDITGPVGNGVQGFAKFERCLVEDSRWCAVGIRKASNSYLASFNDCVFKDVSKENGLAYVTNGPILIQVTDYSNPCPAFGGAEFNNCLISYNNNYPFIGAYGYPTSPGMDNVKLNNVTVVHPSATNAFYSENINTITNSALTAQLFTTVPATNASLTATTSMVECSRTNSTLTASRTSSNTTFPLPVKYGLSGTAYTGNDFSLVTYFEIIPKGLLSKQSTLEVITDNVTESSKTATVTISSSGLYSTVAPTAATISITDCAVANILVNPGFESALTTGWTSFYDSDNGVRNVTSKRSGSNGLQLGSGAGGKVQPITAGFAAGLPYTLSAWCKLTATGSSGGSIGVFCKNSGGTVVGSFSAPVTNSAAFEKKTVSFTVPASTTKMEVYAYYNGGGTTKLYADDFGLTAGTTAVSRVAAPAEEAEIKIEIPKSKIYPNPVNRNFFTINTSGIRGKKQISLFDLSGRLVYTQQLQESDLHTIKLSSKIAKGSYMLKIVTTESSFSEILIVE